MQPKQRETKQPAAETLSEGEPTALTYPVPVWLMVMLFFLLYCGMVHFDQHGGWFDAHVYAPYRSLEEVAMMEPPKDDFRGRLEAYSEKNEDFEEAVQEVAPLIRGAALEVLMDSRHAPEIIHHLAKNPEDAERLSTLSPLATAREIGKIEARLESKPVKKTTSAPPPAKTVSGGKTVSNLPSDDDTDADWLRKREAQLKAQRSR